MSNSILESVNASASGESTGKSADTPASSTVMSMQQALNRALDEVLADNPKAVIFGEDCGQLGGVFRITDGLQAKHAPSKRPATRKSAPP